MFGKKEGEDYSVRTVEIGVDKLTAIALGATVRGTIAVGGDLCLDGITKGSASCRGETVIGPRERIKGNVVCTGTVLHGMLQGDIQVAEDLTMRLGCTMNGDVYICRPEIESKARFNGTYNTTEEDAPVTNQVVKPETVDTKK